MKKVPYIYIHITENAYEKFPIDFYQRILYERNDRGSLPSVSGIRVYAKSNGIDRGPRS